MAMPRDVTWPMQFFAYNLSGKHFTLTSCGVIRNQRSKIRRSNIISTARCPFRKISKFECRVIKHARYVYLIFTRQRPKYSVHVSGIFCANWWPFWPNVLRYGGWWLITLHSTLTWLTLTRSLDGSDGHIKALTLYSDHYPNTNQNPNQNPNPNPNEKFDLLPYMAMSRDITWPKQFLAHNFSGKLFNPTSCGVIRNQRSKIRQSNIISTTGGLSQKSQNSSV